MDLLRAMINQLNPFHQSCRRLSTRSLIISLLEESSTLLFASPLCSWLRFTMDQRHTSRPYQSRRESLCSVHSLYSPFLSQCGQSRNKCTTTQSKSEMATTSLTQTSFSIKLEMSSISPFSAESQPFFAEWQVLQVAWFWVHFSYLTTCFLR